MLGGGSVAESHLALTPLLLALGERRLARGPRGVELALQLREPSPGPDGRHEHGDADVHQLVAGIGEARELLRRCLARPTVTRLTGTVVLGGFGIWALQRAPQMDWPSGDLELDSFVMLADEYPAFNKSPFTLGGTPVKLCLMSDDVDADLDRATKAGAEVVRPVTDQFSGPRACCLRDPFGHEWTISQEIEKVTPEEMQRRWNAMVPA